MPISIEKTTQNNITVIEFSLTPDARDELERKLKSYVDGKEITNLDDLAKIVSEVLGAIVIEELKKLSHKNIKNKTVYVIHNLPEISDKQAIKLFQNYSKKAVSNHHLKTYTHYFVAGLTRLLSLKEKDSFRLVRRFGDNDTLEGKRFHNHFYTATALAGVVSDNTSTQFMNLQTLMEEQNTDEMKVESAFNNVQTITDYKNRENWSDQIEFEIINESTHAKKLSHHTRDIIVGKGDLVLWSEQGYLLHRSIPSNTKNAVHKTTDILRIIGAYCLENER